MRLIRIDSPRLGQHLRCISCQRWVDAEAMMANLDGPAFVSYWCVPCQARVRAHRDCERQPPTDPDPLVCWDPTHNPERMR